jgi:threonine/homoserine/homoserine lactone efflux protein
MQLSTWLIFSGFALIYTLSPGPAVLLSVTNSIMHGFLKSIFSSFGNIIGIFIVSSVAVLGLGAILQTSVLLFTLLKLFGAVYLIYLGIRQWRSKQNIFMKNFNSFQADRGKLKSFIQGLIVAISNPKSILFFTALFPQFVDISRPIAIQFFILTMTFMLFSFLSLIIYALSAHSVRSWFSRGNRASWYNRVSGAIFISFGLGMLQMKNRSV